MSPQKRRLLPWLSLLVVYVVWGSTYLAIRMVVHELPPVATAGARFFVAGLVMAAVAAFVEGRRARPTPRQLFDYSLVGVLLLTCGNALVMWSEKRIESGIAALIVASVPLWLTLFDGMRPGGQAWTLRVWLGTLLGLLGVVLVARPQGHVAPGHWVAIGALQLATLAWTAGSLYAQSVRERLPILSASAVEMLAGSLALFAISRMVGEDLSVVALASTRAWGALAYLVVFGSLLGFTAFAYCLNELPASTVGTYAYVNPVVAVLLGWLVLDEPISPGLVAGAALILAAVVLSTTRRRQPRPAAAVVRERVAGAAE